MISKEISEQVINIIIKKGIEVGSILIKETKNNLNILVIMGVKSYVDKRLVVFEYINEIPTEEQILRDIHKKNQKYVAIKQLEEYRVYGKIQDSLFSLFGVMYANEFEETIQEAQIVNRLKIGSILNGTDIYTCIVISKNPFRWIRVKGIPCNYTQEGMANLIVNAKEVSVQKSDEECRVCRWTWRYVTELSENETKQLVLKLQLLGILR